LIEIYKIIPIQVVLLNSKFNFKHENININGYNWCEDLQVSIQGKCANDTMREILHMTKINNIQLCIHIQLNNGEIVKYTTPNI
jgi:hypothetical protein